MESTLKARLKSHLQQQSFLDLSTQLASHACVAVILKGTSLNSLEVGFIQRALSQTDRWSGQLAFPGGRREASDVTDLCAALRETREEIGMPLTDEALIGRLHDIQARKSGQLLDFYIRPFVFFYPDPFSMILQPEEVADFFWYPVNELQLSHRHTTLNLAQAGDVTLELPAITLTRGEPPLWGLTYLMIQDLLRRLGMLASTP